MQIQSVSVITKLMYSPTCTQLGATPIPNGNFTDPKYLYEVTFWTGSSRHHATSAQVSCELYGARAISGAVVLKDDSRKLFRSGGTNSFFMRVKECLGPLRGVKVLHNNRGYDPSWYLSRIKARDCQTNEIFLFVANCWLAVDEGDGKIERYIDATGKEELTKFKMLFNTKLSRDLEDAHIWFSVFYKPVRSRFTRVQRLSCCLSVLCSAMVASSMFYGQGPDPDLNDESRWSFGPISISLKQLVIGLLSSIVVIPYNLLIVTIFRNSRAKEDQTSLSAATRQDPRQGKSQTKTLDQILSDKNKKRHLQEKVNIESKSLKTNNTDCKNCSSSDNGRTIEHKTVEVDRMNNSYSYISCNKTNDNNNNNNNNNNNDNNNNSKNYNNINIQSTNDSNGNSINDTKIDNDNKPNVSLDEVTVSMYDQEIEESKKGKKRER